MLGTNSVCTNLRATCKGRGVFSHALSKYHGGSNLRSLVCKLMLFFTGLDLVGDKLVIVCMTSDDCKFPPAVDSRQYEPRRYFACNVLYAYRPKNKKHVTLYTRHCNC